MPRLRVLRMLPSNSPPISVPSSYNGKFLSREVLRGPTLLGPQLRGTPSHGSRSQPRPIYRLFQRNLLPISGIRVFTRQGSGRLCGIACLLPVRQLV